MKLNIGSGTNPMPGYFNIDAAALPGVQQVADARQIALPDEVADEVISIHLVEHFYRWEVPVVLKEWARLLKPRGKLVVELPDVVKCCSNIVHGREGKHPDQLGLWGIYGDPGTANPLMMHRWGWTFSTLSPLIAAAGFVYITEHETKFHGTGRGVRDFRVEAFKKDSA